MKERSEEGSGGREDGGFSEEVIGDAQDADEEGTVEEAVDSERIDPQSYTQSEHEAGDSHLLLVEHSINVVDDDEVDSKEREHGNESTQLWPSVYSIERRQAQHPRRDYRQNREHARAQGEQVQVLDGEELEPEPRGQAMAEHDLARADKDAFDRVLDGAIKIVLLFPRKGQGLDGLRTWREGYSSQDVGVAAEQVVQQREEDRDVEHETGKAQGYPHRVVQHASRQYRDAGKDQRDQAHQGLRQHAIELETGHQGVYLGRIVDQYGVDACH